MFPNGEEGEDNSDYVAVFLTSRRQEDLEVKYDFSVLKSDGTYWSRIGNTFKKFSPEQNSWGYGKAFSKAKLMEKYVPSASQFLMFLCMHAHCICPCRSNELLPGGRLTIVCNLEIYYSDRHTQGKIPKFEFKFEDQSSLGDNMSKAFNNLEYSDVTIICGDETEEAPNVAAAPAALASPPAAVPSTSAAAAAAQAERPPAAAVQPPNPNVKRYACHKAVLAARSDVFAAMFSHKATTESTTNEVHIRDTEPDILEQLLNFVYTDKVHRFSITLHTGDPSG